MENFSSENSNAAIRPTAAGLDDRQAVPDQAAAERWLQRYYFGRALFGIAWVVAAVMAGPGSPFAAALLVILYPAWDALANVADLSRSGGLRRNRTQAFNAVASAAVALTVAIALPDMHRVLGIFGTWAIVSGLLQLATALGRRKTRGAQWPMIASGAQSTLAGAFFVYQAGMPAMPSLATLTGYAGFGAFYFLVAALALAMRRRHRKVR